MPIQINLLNEALALEDSRRRDPVKRVIVAGVILVLLVLAWSSSLMVKTMMAKAQLGQLQAELNSRTNDYRQILENQSRLTDAKQRLTALQRLANSRFLMGSTLNALQHSTVDNVQLVRCKVSQTYILTEGGKAETNGAVVTPARPATATEKIALTLDAKDTSPNPGDAVTTYQDSVSSTPSFQSLIGKTNSFHLVNIGAPQTLQSGKPFRLFTIECRFPEKIR